MTALGREHEVFSFLHTLPATPLNWKPNLFQPRGSYKREQINLNDNCSQGITHWKTTNQVASLQKLCKNYKSKTVWVIEQ